MVKGKLRIIDGGQVAFCCEGCGRYHYVNIDGAHGPKWEFNGDYDKPTFSPSVMVTFTHPKGYSNERPAPFDFDGEYETEICHSFIVDGNIEYLADCTHKLAGRTIALQDLSKMEGIK